LKKIVKEAHEPLAVADAKLGGVIKVKLGWGWGCGCGLKGKAWFFQAF
jgi:hypothetical protein